MCDVFNQLFGSVFAKEKLRCNPEANIVYKGKHNGVCGILITEEIVTKKLNRLKNDK